MKSQALSCCALAGLLAGLSGHAFAGQDGYFWDFESGEAGAEWSATALSQTQGFSRFLGNFSSRTVALNVGLEGAVTHELVFDFFAIDSWDGSDSPWGPDYFGVKINGVEQMRYTFSNWNGPETFPGEALVTGVDLGFATYTDSIYRLSMTFDAIVGRNTIEFFASGLEPINNESWGLDNVGVRALPAPGAAGVLGACGLACLRRRRR